MAMRTRDLLVLLAAVTLLASCAAGDPRFSTEVAGFWVGLWHGLIAPITLVVHLFDADVRVYELHNSGGWYDFGFLFGAITFWGGSSHGVRRRRVVVVRSQ